MQQYFTPATFKFLGDLAANNDREWFGANKDRFLEEVQERALAFIAALGPRLEKVSPYFNAVPTTQGGSLFRIYRDTRFGKDKTPYKPWVAMRFTHDAGADVHAPGFYLHLEPDNSYAGVGLWRPEAAMARQIREAIVSDPAGWKKATQGKAFTTRYAPDGESLVRPPQGFDPAHPLIEDLKRKDFIAGARLDDDVVVSTTFLSDYITLCKTASPFMGFLTRAVGLPF